MVYHCKIYHVNISDRDFAAQYDICQPWVHVKCDKHNHITTIIAKAQMSPGTVFLVAVKFFLLEHKQIKTSSLPSQQQTYSLKVQLATIIKKVYFH